MIRTGTTSDTDGINVSIAVLGGEVTPLFMAVGSTVEQALVAAGLATTSVVKCRGEEVSLADVLEEGDRLFITTKVKGGTL